MTTSAILDSIYIIPVILDHLNKPTTTTTKIIEKYNIDIEEMRKIKNLLEYHHSIIKSNFKPNYPLLRLGLREYGDLYMSQIFNLLNIVNKNWNVLDYGSGEGQLSDYFLTFNPDSIVIKLDKDIEPSSTQLKINFEENYKWYKEYEEKFNCILLSEILHCKDYGNQYYLIKSSNMLLKPKGTLIIIENIDYCMAYRITKIKNRVYKVLTPEKIETLTENSFKIKNKFIIKNHIIYIYEKI